MHLVAELCPLVRFVESSDISTADEGRAAAAPPAAEPKPLCTLSRSVSADEAPHASTKRTKLQPQATLEALSFVLDAEDILLALDVETTGWQTSSKTWQKADGRVMQFGLATRNVNDGSIRGFEATVRPRCGGGVEPVDPRCAEITGMSQTDVDAGHEMELVLCVVGSAILKCRSNGGKLLIHNVSCDRKHLENELSLATISHALTKEWRQSVVEALRDSNFVVDTCSVGVQAPLMHLNAAASGRTGQARKWGYSLSDGIEILFGADYIASQELRAHTAGDDCKMTIQLFLELERRRTHLADLEKPGPVPSWRKYSATQPHIKECPQCQQAVSHLHAVNARSAAKRQAKAAALAAAIAALPSTGPSWRRTVMEQRLRQGH